MRSPAARWLLSLYGLFGFITTVIDQFFPADSERLKMLYLLPKWHWPTWVIIGLSIIVIVMFSGGYAIWKDKEGILAASAATSPRVVLDFEPYLGDVPTKRNRVLVVRNVGPAAAFNVRLKPFKVGDTTIVCDPVNQLTQDSASRGLTCEVRIGNNAKKPVLLYLEKLFAGQNETVPLTEPTSMEIAYTDFDGRHYSTKYSVKYVTGVNECQFELKA